ncbi:MAG: hypothetical protein EOO20_05430 [Chryseobacterium sp.]|nr:MAG: hypothetical protein EOO20_05430 [Chryseobacterium sp.]
MANQLEEQICRACGCTDLDCRQCIQETGEPCYWIEENLCSACIHKVQVHVVCEISFPGDQEDYVVNFDTYVTPGKEDVELTDKSHRQLMAMGFSTAIIQNITHTIL